MQLIRSKYMAESEISNSMTIFVLLTILLYIILYCFFYIRHPTIFISLFQVLNILFISLTIYFIPEFLYFDDRLTFLYFILSYFYSELYNQESKFRKH